MRKYIILLGLFMSLSLVGQNKWTLRQCIDYAVENNIELKQQALGVEQSKINVNTAKMSRLPDLNASVGQDFSFGRSTGGDNISQKMNAAVTSFRVASNIPLFTGFRIPNEIKMNELNLLASIEGLKKAKENMELQVASYYLDVLFKKELVKIHTKQIEQTKTQVERTQILVDGGKVPLAQLYDIKAQLATDELNLTNSNNNLVLALLDLSQVLNLTDSEKFDIEEPQIADVIAENIASILPPNQIYEQAISIKPHVREAEYKLESEKKNLKIAESGYWPSLDFSLGYSTRYTRTSKAKNELGEDIDTGVSRKFKRQFRDYGSEVIGFSLSIPIFNRFQTKNKVKGVKLQIMNRTLDLDNVKLAFYKEIQQAYQSAVAAQAKYDATEKAFMAANEAYKYAEEKYSVGKSTVFEFNEARLKLITSQSEQVQSKYDFLFRAKILDFYRGIEINI